MTRVPRHAMLALWASFVLTTAACAPATPNRTPNPSPTSSIVPTARAPATPSASTTSTATPSPSVTASSLACAVTAQTGLLPSDRLIDLGISSTSTQDLVTFAFAAASSPSPAGPPRGALDAVQPPFSHASSGHPIDLLGEHAVQVRFTGMTIASGTGEATYKGPDDVKPSLPALREAIQYDASEGVIGWYIGYNGPGCVTLSRNGNDVTVVIAHLEAPAG